MADNIAYREQIIGNRGKNVDDMLPFSEMEQSETIRRGKHPALFCWPRRFTLMKAYVSVTRDFAKWTPEASALPEQPTAAELIMPMITGFVWIPCRKKKIDQFRDKVIVIYAPTITYPSTRKMMAQWHAAC